MKKILNPHPEKFSRSVHLDDIERVEADALELHRICHEPIGLYTGGQAMAHPQIEEDDPLRFFVKKDGTIIINPIITGYFEIYKNTEGCMSFPNREQVRVERFKMISIEYIGGKVGEKIDMNNVIRRQSNGKKEAAVFQHEIGHFDLDLIY